MIFPVNDCPPRLAAQLKTTAATSNHRFPINPVVDPRRIRENSRRGVDSENFMAVSSLSKYVQKRSPLLKGMTSGRVVERTARCLYVQESAISQPNKLVAAEWKTLQVNVLGASPSHVALECSQFSGIQEDVPIFRNSKMPESRHSRESGNPESLDCRNIAGLDARLRGHDAWIGC